MDYTKMRKGQMIDNKYVVVCPKCHRKGLRYVAEPQDGQQVITYVHTDNDACPVVNVVTARDN